MTTKSTQKTTTAYASTMKKCIHEYFEDDELGRHAVWSWDKTCTYLNAESLPNHAQKVTSVDAFVYGACARI